jgi:hypothetical protein
MIARKLRYGDIEAEVMQKSGTEGRIGTVVVDDGVEFRAVEF